MKSVGLVLAALLGACSSSSGGGTIDAALDIDAPATVDSRPGTPDAKPNPDTAPHPDAAPGTPDAKPTPDAAVRPDSAPGAPDAAIHPDATIHPDAMPAPPDAGAPDAFVPDAAPPDAPPAVVTAGACVDGKSWSTPLALDTAGTAGAPRIAVDGMGNVLAVWTQTVAGVDASYVAQYQPGVGWGAPISLNEQSPSHSPQVVLNASGYGALSWIDENPNAVVFAAWYPGSGLQFPSSAEEANTVFATSVAIDDTGYAIGSWAASSAITGASSGLMEANFPGEGLGWEGPTSLASGGGPLLTGGGEGWGFYTSGGNGEGFLYDEGGMGSWQIGNNIAADHTGELELSDWTARGTAGLLMWPQSNSTTGKGEIYTLAIDLTGSPSLPVDSIHNAGHDYDLPSGGFDAEGAQVIAFLDYQGSLSTVLGSHAGNGIAVTAPAILSTGTAERAVVRARGDADGNTFVAWVDASIAAGYDPWIACYSAQHGWRAGVALETGGDAAPDTLQIASGGHGAAAMIWIDGTHAMVTVLQ